MSKRLQKLIQDEALWFAENTGSQAEQTKLQNVFSTTSLAARSYQSNRDRGVTPSGIKSIDAALPEGGLVNGAVHELIAKDFGVLQGQSAKLLTSTLIVQHIKHLLNETPSTNFSKYIIWLSRHDLPSPFILLNGFHALEAEFSLTDPLITHCLFITPESDRQLLQAIDMLLGSPVVSMLIAEVPTIPFADERRFALRTKQHDILSVFLREEKAFLRSSAFHSRWSIAPHAARAEFPTFILTLENKKGMQAKRRDWNIAFQDTDDCFSFREAEQLAQPLEQAEHMAYQAAFP